MTPTPSTHLPAHIYYGIIADARDRDPIVTNTNRATVPMGRGFGLWQRFNPAMQLRWVDDADGTPRALTPKQYAVLELALQLADGDERLTMRAMSSRLAVAPSTVSRALTKLNAWGLVASIAGRGRYAGLVIIRRVKDDGLDRFRKAAKAKVHRWYQALQERLQARKLNVASYFLEEGRSVDSLYYSLLTKDATLKLAQDWTPEELRSVGIL